MKAVILESYVMEEGDLDWSGVKALVPDTVSYVRTAYEEIAPRIGDADIVLLNKCRMDEEILQQCPNLKWVGIIATGTDNLDLEACRRHGVAVANVPGYSTYSVAQMTFSLLLAICQCAERYNRAVKQGCWQLDIPESIGLLPQIELYGKTYGVYGYGSIGRQSARIARAFGMEVLVCTRTVRPEYAADGVEFVDYDTLLRRCDILSLHCPATPQTRGLVNAEALAKMKPGPFCSTRPGARWWMRRPWQRPSTAVSWAFTGPMPLSPSLCLRKAPCGQNPTLSSHRTLRGRPGRHCRT